ncbi:hypothetical protein BKA64DRAFT_362953 [Cadophora sp. MPI-SDFR-AT-0126]|nr:hypothetical protein BKA64DRAFT_362953 [Leotiomycetes sp. MPI-SDFR-AT-0126]
MAGPRDVVARRRNIEGKTKVKTGCTTCRIRRVKCDEAKPFCNRCRSTGRTCDGYESPFKPWTAQSINIFRVSSGGSKSDTGSRPLQPTFLLEVAPQDIELLNRYFSTKTMFNINMGCYEEARQVLQASLTDPSIRHAVSSLRALREDLEASGDGPASIAQPSSGFSYGLQQYNMALGGLASNISSPSTSTLKSALLCCRIFISIEQVQKNYIAMAQHIIRGLRIMHEYRARPCLVEGNQLWPGHNGELPFLDVFIIKLFSAPCKFADNPAAVDVAATTPSVSLDKLHEANVETRNARTILPGIRTQLGRIAALALEFLNKVSQVTSLEAALRLKAEKAALLNSLDTWLTDLERLQAGPEPISVSFLRVFRLILRIVLLGALDSSPKTDSWLQMENDRLQNLANDLSERVKTYVTCTGNSGSGDRSIMYSKVQ